MLTYTSQGLVDAAKPILELIKKIDVQSIVDEIEPLITPKSIKSVTNLLENAMDLLSKTFVSQTQELIGDATPLVATVADLVHAVLKELMG